VRDFNYTADGTFAVDVTNGTYAVTLTMADMAGALHDDVGVYFQGNQYDEVTLPINQALVKTYSVQVTNGQLDLRLADLGGTDPYAVINGLSIGADTSGPQVV